MVDEITLARKIHEVMKEQLAGTGRLRKISISCDEMGGLNTALLNDCWHRIATEPVFKSSFIEVHANPPFARCLMCKEEFELDDNTARCPHCHCEQFTVVHELPTIETYEMDEMSKIDESAA
jgi:Zn finger protein HypA/HybF involved in hydrogenase expression